MEQRSVFRILNKIFLFFLVACFTTAHAETYFSGYSGAVASINPVKNQKVPALTAQAFFAGQFDISGVFLLRTEISVETDNILDHGIFQDTPAYFSIDELSATTKFKTDSASHMAAVFLGEYESIGSDLFMQRQFGIRPIGSKMTETWLGLNGTTIYPFSGLGLSYMIRFLSPQAFAAYFYVNDKEDAHNLNLDFRYAGVADRAILDIALGMGFPIETKDAAGEDVVLLIRTMDLHAGFSLLLGNRHTNSLFLQCGVKRLRLNPNEEEKVLRLSDLYFLVEPRFATKRLNFHFALFNIPEDMANELFYVSNPLGCNLAIFSNNIQLGMFNLTFGTHITVSSPDTTLATINNLSIDNMSLQVAPFATTEVFGGTLNMAMKLDVLNIKKWYDSFKFTLGYKVQL